MPEDCPVPDVPVLELADLHQALRWVAFKKPPLEPRFEEVLDYPPISFLPLGTSEGAQVQGAWRSLVVALGTGRLTASGRRYETRYFDRGGNPVEGQLDCGGRPSRPREVPIGEAESIPPECWSLGAVDRLGRSVRCGSYRYREICMSFTDLQLVFPATPSSDIEAPPAKSRGGRPPKVQREVWLERLAVLALAGIVNKDISADGAAATLLEELARLGLDKVSLHTVRTDWLGPLLREAKERAEGN